MNLVKSSPGFKEKYKHPTYSQLTQQAIINQNHSVLAGECTTLWCVRQVRQATKLQGFIWQINDGKLWLGNRCPNTTCQSLLSIYFLIVLKAQSCTAIAWVECHTHMYILNIILLNIFASVNHLAEQEGWFFSIKVACLFSWIGGYKKDIQSNSSCTCFEEMHFNLEIWAVITFTFSVLSPSNGLGWGKRSMALKTHPSTEHPCYTNANWLSDQRQRNAQLVSPAGSWDPEGTSRLVGWREAIMYLPRDFRGGVEEQS